MRRHEKRVVVGQFPHLARGDLGKLVPAIADIDAPEARHCVENTFALGIGQPRALAPRDDARALGTQGVLL